MEDLVNNISLLSQVLEIATRAGREILEVYENDFTIKYKRDGSPLTIADQRAHNLIKRSLQDLTTNIPVLSEESSVKTFKQRSSWSRFWLVDPLDGTKEFIRHSGEFTVNIALIERCRPVLGVVHTPVSGISHYAAQGNGAFHCTSTGQSRKIQVRPVTGSPVIMTTSRSHSSGEVLRYRQNIEKSLGPVETVSLGSSLKICLVAEGSADIYPRLGPTSEWDTAAAHCILMEAGGEIIDVCGKSLCYNKTDILNPWFFACGDIRVDWAGFLSD